MSNSLSRELDNGGLGLTIGEFSGRYGVSLRTIRFYEAAGLLSPTRIGTSRYFSRRDGIRMELTLKGKQLGFSLREIKELVNAHVCSNNKEPSAMTDVLDTDRMVKQLKMLHKQKEDLDVAIQQLQDARQLVE